MLMQFARGARLKVGRLRLDDPFACAGVDDHLVPGRLDQLGTPRRVTFVDGKRTSLRFDHRSGCRNRAWEASSIRNWVNLEL